MWITLQDVFLFVEAEHRIINVALIANEAGVDPLHI